MSAFVDSSALVKRYADEPGADIVRAESVLTVSCLVHAEIPSAIWRMHRDERLDEATARALVTEFEFEWEDERSPIEFIAVDISDELLTIAASYPAIHGLTALDSLQLASAKLVQTVGSSTTRFLCADRALARAADAEGFTVTGPGEPPQAMR